MVGITKKIRKFITGESAVQRKRRLGREATLNRIERQAVFDARKAGAKKFAQARVRAENKRRLKRIAEGSTKRKASGAGAVAGAVFKGLQRGVGSQSILGESAPPPRKRSRRTRKRRTQSSFGLSSGF